LISFRLPRDTNLLQPAIIELTRFPGRLEARLGHDRAQLSLRLANGDRIDSMTLHWDESLLAESRLEITLSAEFAIIDQALAKLLDNHQAGHADSLRQGVFRRKPVLQELMRALSMDPLQWKPTVRNTALATQPTRSRLEGDLALLEPYCAHCHGDETLHPPGFLSGSSVQKKVLQCAPRILRRLQAWQESNHFPRSPMPPPASIEYSGISAVDWPQSEHYRTLVNSLENLVSTRQDKQLLSNWREADYGNLPACLASASES
jgi:hypothetical protein